VSISPRSTDFDGGRHLVWLFAGHRSIDGGGGGLPGTELVVVVADANSAFRSGVVGVLERETDIRAVPAAATEALIGLVDGLQPAVVLADVDLPPGGRLAAIERIKRRAPMTQTVAIATAPDREVVLAVMRAGARGIIERTVHSTSLVRVVRHAAAGEITLPRRHSGYVLDELARAERGVDARAALMRLSTREREILALIRTGLRNREIAVVLSISELTVKRHVHNMLEKLRVPTRSAAVSLAVAAERWPSTEAELLKAQARSTTQRHKDAPSRR
jgi:DNA-binding NarL/FixJ family response regulator